MTRPISSVTPPIQTARLTPPFMTTPMRSSSSMMTLPGAARPFLSCRLVGSEELLQGALVDAKRRHDAAQLHAFVGRVDIAVGHAKAAGRGDAALREEISDIRRTRHYERKRTAEDALAGAPGGARGCRGPGGPVGGPGLLGGDAAVRRARPLCTKRLEQRAPVGLGRLGSKSRRQPHVEIALAAVGNEREIPPAADA